MSDLVHQSFRAEVQGSLIIIELKDGAAVRPGDVMATIIQKVLAPLAICLHDPNPENVDAVERWRTRALEPPPSDLP